MTTPDEPLTWTQGELGFDDDMQESPSDPYGPETYANRTGPQQQDVFDYAVGNYQIPTSTSNPLRPRTVAAKFEPDENAVYVVMRPYKSNGAMKTPVVKYFPLRITDWRNFRAAYSKGRYILLNWDGGGVGHEEVSDFGGFDAFLLTAANYARSQQEAREGLQEGQSATSEVYKKLRRAVAEGRKVSDVKLRSDRLGGSTRKRAASRDAAVKSFYKKSP